MPLPVGDYSLVIVSSRLSSTLATTVLVLFALAGGCDSSEDRDTARKSEGTSTGPAAAPEPRGEQAAAIDRPALHEHLRALQRIATKAGGNRAAFIHPESASGVLVELYETRGGP